MESTLHWKKLLLLVALCLLASFSFSQVTQQWVKKYNGPGDDQAIALAVDARGNVYVTGKSGFSGGDYQSDYVTIKYDSTGKQLWLEKYSSPDNYDDIPAAIAVDAAGNVYVTGTSYGTAEDVSARYTTVKYDSAGKELWVRNGPQSDVSPAAAIAVDSAGNVYVTGTITDYEDDYALTYGTIKYNANGDELWLKTYGTGDFIIDKSRSLVVGPSGSVYVTGADGTVTYDPNGNELWSKTGLDSSLAVDRLGNVYVTGDSTRKYDANGRELWARNSGGNSLAVDSSGDVYVTGSNGTLKYNRKGTVLWSNKNRGRSLVVDGLGNIFIMSTSNGDDVITKYDTHGSKQWRETYNGSGNGADVPAALAADRNGNVYVTGQSYGFVTSTDYATIKYDVDGRRQWVSRYNSPGISFDVATSVLVDANNNVYVTGASGGEYATLKYSAQGDQLWLRRYNKPGDALALAMDRAGDVYVTGTSGTVKYSASGKQLWATNGSGKALAVDSAYNVYVTGTVRVAGGDNDFVTVKYDANGNRLWRQRFDGPGAEEAFSKEDNVAALAIDPNGNVYITGVSIRKETGADYTTIKYDTNGAQQWIRTYTSTGDAYDAATALVVDGAGNVYVTGKSGSYDSYEGPFDFATIKYDTHGNRLWVKRYNGPKNGYDAAKALTVDCKGSVYVTGESSSSVYLDGTRDIVTVKYDGSGKQLWVKTYNDTASGDDFPTSIGLDNVGNVYITGSSGSGTGNQFATIKYDTSGHEQWIEKYSGPENGYDIATSLAVGRTGNVYVTGTTGGYLNSFYTTIKYVQTPLLTVDAGKDKTTYFLPFIPTCTVLRAQAKGGEAPYQFLWSPNGATSQSTVVCPTKSTTYTVMVTDANGLKAKDQVNINVIDVRCGANKDKVLVCYQGTTRCGGPWQAFLLLGQGATLGACPSAPVTSIKSSDRSDQEAVSAPRAFKVYNFPNPFSNSTQIYYELPEEGHVTVTVYDALGRQITTIASGNYKAGVYSRVFTPSSLLNSLLYYQVNYTTKQPQVLRKTGEMLLVR